MAAEGAAAGIAEPAWAKVNLFLHVVGKRADGYHLLDSLAVFACVGDVVRVAPGSGLSLAVVGRFGAGLGGEENLVLRAARALGGGRGASLTLEKNLPVASGIGGGSADAAAALRGLARLWGVERGGLGHLAAGLGADVPVCLASVPARMGGVGEVLGPAPALPAFGMVLVNPGVAVSTPAVFRARDGAFSAEAVLPDGWIGAVAMADALRALGNDLEAPALVLCPAVGEVLAWLRARPGCLLARMSGSGATCFGFFETPEAAAGQAALVPAGWWGWGGGMASGATLA